MLRARRMSFNVIEEADGVSFWVRVSPRASKNEVEGPHGDALRVRLTAPPVDGEANKALTKLFAKYFGVAKSRIEILQGESARNKRVRIRGLRIADLAVLGNAGSWPTST